MALRFQPEVTASLGVMDMDRSIRWYADVLGFSIIYRMDEMGWCEMSTHMPGVIVGLSEVQEVKQGGGATNVWTVTDIALAKAHLDAHGVRQDGDIQHIPDMVKLLTFYDPDGNAMMLAQTLAQQQAGPA